jgi:putative OPT family oligopeptide transporter
MSAQSPPESPATIGPDGNGQAASEFEPFVPATEHPPELTLSAVALGTVLGIIFGASSLYLSLKVGLTVSASIPVAVLSIALFRAFGKGKGRVLENNIVQTTGSAGESIAFGVGVTMPALMILGFDLDQALFHVGGFKITRVMLVATLGSLLGILMMIPLRRAFIVKQHGKLVYPEGTACAKVLIAGEKGGASARPVVVGLVVSFLYMVLMKGLKLWQDTPARVIGGLKGAFVASEASPVLIGVGYIIGFRISAIMVGGGILASFVLTPVFAMFVPVPTPPTGKEWTVLETTMKHWGAIREDYVLYIGAGAVAMGGLISLVQALPTIFGGLARSIGGMGGKSVKVKLGRTDRDLPLWLVFLGAAGLIATISATNLIPSDTTGRIVGSVLIVLLGFLFVTVSSRLTGEIGSSSNPISGMTVGTLLITCLVFTVLGWTDPSYKLAALSIAGIVCIASSNGGTTSQDLKTGYLVGATPAKQQISILIGSLASALVIGWFLLVLNDNATVYSSIPENLPRIAAPADLAETATYEGKDYKVWRIRFDVKEGDKKVAEAGKYLVDPSSNKVAYLVDPGINGRLKFRDDGKTPVDKFDAPKARLMQLIIDGIMDGKLRWDLVIIGAFIAALLQLSGVPSLAFSVGVYLPLWVSLPIFIGGLLRLTVDKIRRSTASESDSSPAVLLASGFIAGGIIAETIVSFVNASPTVVQALNVSKYLPGSYNDSPLPAVVAIGGMALLLVLVGVGKLLHVSEPREVEKGIVGREEDL